MERLVALPRCPIMEFFWTFVGYLASLCATAIVLTMSVSYLITDMPTAFPKHVAAVEVSAQKHKSPSGREITRRLAASAMKTID